MVDCDRFEPVGLSCKLKDRPSIENSQRWASSGVTLAWTKCIKMRDIDILWYIDYYDWSCMNHLGRSRDFRIQNQNESKQNKRCYALLCTSSCSLALPPPNWSSLWMLSSKFLPWIAASTSGFPRHGCHGLRHLWTWWFLDVSGGFWYFLFSSTWVAGPPPTESWCYPSKRLRTRPLANHARTNLRTTNHN